MYTGFQNPPRQFRMLQIIHGFPKGETLDQTLDFLVARGYGGVVCNVGFNDYLESEEEWQHFLRGIEGCKQRELRVWLYDEKGYPSGKAGTLVLRDHPEFETRGIVCAKTEGTGVIRHVLPVDERMEGDALFVGGCPLVGGTIDPSETVDLTALVQGGAVEWDASAGGGAVMSFHVRRLREGTHIICNVSDDSPYINIIDADAVRRFIDLTHEAYAARLGQDLGATAEAMFTDEPSLMSFYLKAEPGLLPVAPWAPDLLEQFEAQAGYDLRPNLPALFEECGHPCAQVRLDFWQLISQMIEERYYGQIEQWCAEHNIAASGHALTEEFLWWQVGFEGDLYRDLRRMHIPGVDQLSSYPHELVRAEGIPIEKLVSSVAHMNGKRLCMSETSTHVQRMGGLPVTDEQIIGTANFQYVLGLTQLTSYWGMNELTPEQMKRFNDHIGRLGALLVDGVHVCSLAVYVPTHTAWAGFKADSVTAYEANPGKLCAEVTATFNRVSRVLLHNQYDFDYLDDQAIAEAQIDRGKLVARSEPFRVIILPLTVAIPLSTWRKLEEFVVAGGTLVSIGALPTMASTNGTEAEVQEVSERLSRHVRVEILDDAALLPDVLGYFTSKDFMVSPPSPDLLYTHRMREGQHVYFVVNCGDTAIKPRVTIGLRGEPEVWDPYKGEIRQVSHQVEVVGTVFNLELAPYEGLFVVFGMRARNVVDEDAELEACCSQQSGHCGKCHLGEEEPPKPALAT